MTQQMTKDAIVLFGAVVFLLGAVFPGPIVNGATQEPYANQLLARLALLAIGIVGIWAWYGIHSQSN